MVLTDRQEDILLSALSGLTLSTEDEAELQLIGARLIANARVRQAGAIGFRAHLKTCGVCQGKCAHG